MACSAAVALTRHVAYRFAAPKVGSQSMWGDVRPRSLNVCNVRDVVPCAPFRGVTAVGACK